MDVTLIIPILKVAVQIAFIAGVLYKLYDVFHQSKAVAAFYVMFFYGFVLLVSHYLELRVLENMLKYMLVPFFIAVVIAFQDDIKASIVSGRNSIRMIRKRENFVSAPEIKAILSALYALADMKRGALVIIKKNDRIDDKLKNTPTVLDCEITSNVIVTIFSYDTPLHDGAIVVANNRIQFAGCVLPSSSKGSIKPSEYVPQGESEADELEDDLRLASRSRRENKIFGTRHRAAIGITEVSDAIAIVVSEESKAISICYGGNIYYDLGQDDAVVFLDQLLGYDDKKE